MNNTDQILYTDNSSRPALDNEALTSSIDLIDRQEQNYYEPPHLEHKAYLTKQLNEANNYALGHKNIKPTTTNLAHYIKKFKIKKFLQQSTKEFLFPYADYLACEKSVKNSLLILERLDDSYDLPKIAIDEDGVIIFAWKKVEKTCMLTFEKDLLHFYSHNNQGNTLERIDGEKFSVDTFFLEISHKIF